MKKLKTMSYRSDDLQDLQVDNSYLRVTNVNVLWSCRVINLQYKYVFKNHVKSKRVGDIKQ